jgi:hypothetical protein
MSENHARGAKHPKDTDAKRKYVSPNDYVKLTGLSLSTVHRRLAMNQIPKFQPGGPGTRILIPADFAEELLTDIEQTGVSQSESPAATANLAPDLARRDALAGRKPLWMSGEVPTTQ